MWVNEQILKKYEEMKELHRWGENLSSEINLSQYILYTY
jgi:hypothetical protein